MATKKCVFCQSKENLTLEHVFPEWLSRLYPNGLVVTNEFVGDQNKKWESTIFNHKTRVVCKICNEGWMSELEVRVIPIITKMFTLKKTIISQYEQEELAFWAQKTMLMLNLAIPGSLKITSDLYEDLYKSSSSSKKVLVNIGWRMKFLGDKDNPIASYHIIQIPFVDVKKELEDAVRDEIEKGGIIWKATLALGPCLFELIGHNMKVILEIGVKTQVFKTIRPYKNVIDWPLEWPIEAEGGLEKIKSRI